MTRGPSPEGSAAPDEVEVDLSSGVLNIRGPSNVIVNVASSAEVIINVNALSEEGSAPPSFTVREQ